jgi:DNA-binding NarL/FixJ family response regulator
VERKARSLLLLFSPSSTHPWRSNNNNNRSRVRSVRSTGGTLAPRRNVKSMRSSHYCVKKRQAPAGEPIALSDRQLEVLALLAEGATDNEIAIQLHLSVPTVCEYVRAIRTRLNARSRAHAVALALRQGILPGGSLSSEQS